MAEASPTTPAVRWNNALAVLHNLNMKLIETPPHKAEAIETAIAGQEEVLLELDAPHLMGVVSKLELLWSVDLDKPDRDGDAKRLVVADLSNLIGLAA